MEAHEAVLAGLGVPAPTRSSAGLHWEAIGASITEVSSGCGGPLTVSLNASFDQVARGLCRIANAFDGQVDESGAVVAGLLLQAYRCPIRPEPHVGEAQRFRLAWPDERIALLLPGERSPRATEWSTFAVSGTWHQAIRTIQRCALEVGARTSAVDATNPSEAEQRVARALQAGGLPPFQRGVEIRNQSGRVISRPDYAWPEVGLILELHGWWWHSGQHIASLIEAESVEGWTKAADRSRFERDAAKSRALPSLGWVVTYCTDTEIAKGMLAAVVEDTARNYAHLAAARRVA